MPTPYGFRGGMAFSADELRVLRRALAAALKPLPAPAPAGSVPASRDPRRTEEVRDCLRLAEALDEAEREGGRLRAFLLADLARYREALPGSAHGYLERLQEALAAGYVPGSDDLAALRVLRSPAVGPAERARRADLLRRCEQIAERSARTRLRALPGGRAADEPERPAQPQPAPKPAQPGPAGPRPGRRGDRPVPTPGEVFPPRRRPTPPPAARTA
ncbi:hypothetical protein C3486_23045 [Streptomyces sp. Ru73]|uniref:hypothetical protein n=1 Tax=Streptomyces sp. Ru73 TaxID=2080748 RepID=UPI000CDD6A3D|nr:hypothetical protein [Streptomyces sp. Ru73]POX38500.1 hypothetical protein C3486_23045 [Streptomyces sp. Ru73]